ncbi:AbiJ-NTD4 domain-containing protein [Tateyamaria sp. SN6-1]|uniref:AbiJ-NTD4 domain-containing protein n=1 Tax=Tateyamaria sp. SN6-1 TaxID=3092148 RepID=UPI0039F600AA
MRFSERLGFKSPQLELDITEIPDPLRNALWDVCLDYLIYPFKEENYEIRWVYTDRFWSLTRRLWSEVLEQPRDTIPDRPDEGFARVRGTFLTADFPELYDILELFHDVARDTGRLEIEFAEACNEVFSREKAALRFLSGRLAPVINEAEIFEVNSAANQTASFGVAKHIARAIELYSDRRHPDYRNSIKEAISAVEAAAKQVVGNEQVTLGQALKHMESEGNLHSALKQGFSNLYGWTNDSDGIRHALMQEENLTEEDARFMLVSCSAFANYFLGKTK